MDDFLVIKRTPHLAIYSSRYPSATGENSKLIWELVLGSVGQYCDMAIEVGLQIGSSTETCEHGQNYSIGYKIVLKLKIGTWKYAMELTK